MSADRPIRLVVMLVTLLAVIAAVASRPMARAAARAAAAARLDERGARLHRLALTLADLHARKLPPQPGDWLEAHPEEGQTFAQYVAGAAIGPDARRTKLYVQPLGTFSPAEARLVGDAADWLQRFYGLRVVRLPDVELGVVPEEARRHEPRPQDLQVRSTWVLDWLVPRRPDDAVAVIALTTADLWPGPGWNFVFGQASLSDRVGVWSLARFGDADRPEALRRTLGTAVHETGHMLGMRHCIAWECVMNGSNNQGESDRAPLWLCPECVAKVWWTCGTDSVRRSDRLADAAAAHGLAREAAYWRAAGDRLRPAR